MLTLANFSITLVIYWMKIQRICVMSYTLSYFRFFKNTKHKKVDKWRSIFLNVLLPKIFKMLFLCDFPSLKCITKDTRLVLYRPYDFLFSFQCQEEQMKNVRRYLPCFLPKKSKFILSHFFPYFFRVNVMKNQMMGLLS